MKMVSLISSLFLIIKISFIKNDIYLRRNQELELYDLFDISNPKCNNSNYITFFTIKVCGKTPIKKTQNFAFTFQDINQKNHSVQCSINIYSKRRLELKISKIEEFDNNYKADIENDTNNQKYNSKIKIIDKVTDLLTNELDNKIYSTLVTNKINNSTQEIIETNKIKINDKNNTSEKINSTIIIDESDLTKSDIIISSDISKLNQIINSDEPTKSNNETKVIETAEIEDYPDVSNYDYCHETLCKFKEMIREGFEVKIEGDFKLFIDAIPEDIFISNFFIGGTSYKIDKCYLIKNIFKQVLKFKQHNSDKKITFNFISILLGKVEKNEEIFVEIYLKNNKKNLRNLELEKNEAKCFSNYDAEPVEGKEVLGSYNCEVSNIENPGDYNGLIFSSSMDIRNISTDKNYNDPALTDELIKEGKIQDFSLPVFTPKNLDLIECDKNNEFKILGKLDRKMKANSQFLIDLILGENNNTKANCSIPGQINGEVNITCKVQDNFYNSKFFIPAIIAMDEKNESSINITEIRYEKEATCRIESQETETQTEIVASIDIDTADTTDLNIRRKYINSSVVFRQISHLKIDLNTNIINFNIIGFAFEKLENNSIMYIPINLIKQNTNNEEKNATCTLITKNEDTSSTSDILIPFIFSCELNNNDNKSQIDDIEIISSPLLINVPTLNINLISAIRTDKLIEEGELLDYMQEENLYKIPPLILNKKIYTNNCNIDGSFEIESQINTIIDRNITFLLRLENSQIDIRCKVPTTNSSDTLIRIKCSTKNSLSNNIIKIKSQIIYDIELNEIFYINEISSDKAICLNNDKLQKEEAQKRANAVVSFRQVSKFRHRNKGYSFYLATFIKKEIENDSKIYLKVRIKSELTENSKNRKLDSLEELTAQCSLSKKTEFNENDIGAAGWDCATGSSSIEDATGLDIIGSDDISGIPDNPELIDPAKTDILIYNGEMKDYSKEENLNELLPIFNILSANFSLCKQNGSFSFIGNVTSSIVKDIVFNISLSYPVSSVACRLPRTLKGKIVQIECFNRDDFENSTVIIEETVIRDGFNEYFILKNISSGDMFVTCSSSEKEVNEMKYSEDFKVISRAIKEKSSGGIGSTGLLVIITVGVIVLIAVIFLMVFINRKNKQKIIDKNNIKNTNSSGSSFGSSSSSYY